MKHRKPTHEHTPDHEVECDGLTWCQCRCGHWWWEVRCE